MFIADSIAKVKQKDPVSSRLLPKIPFVKLSSFGMSHERFLVVCRNGNDFDRDSKFRATFRICWNDARRRIRMRSQRPPQSLTSSTSVTNYSFVEHPKSQVTLLTQIKNGTQGPLESNIHTRPCHTITTVIGYVKEPIAFVSQRLNYQTSQQS